jgi:hypothetical protein
MVTLFSVFMRNLFYLESSFRSASLGTFAFEIKAFYRNFSGIRCALRMDRFPDRPLPESGISKRDVMSESAGQWFGLRSLPPMRNSLHQRLAIAYSESIDFNSSHY